MSNYKIQTQDTNYPVCLLTISGITCFGRNSAMQHYFKTILCCGQLKVVHHNCADKFSSLIDSTYNFDATAYEGGNKIRFLCMKCGICFFHC